MNRIQAFALLTVGLASVAAADTIILKHEAVGQGTLNGTPFGPANIVLTCTGDTANRQSLGFGWWIDHDQAVADIAGVGVVTFTTGTRTFVNNPANIVGFSRAGGSGTDLLNGPINAAFAGWDMLSPVGPIVGGGSWLQWTLSPMDTTGGVLVLESLATTITFTATIGSACYPDCEQDGDLDIFDFLCFQGEFANQTKYADCEKDGDHDIFDFLCFQGQFANGCN